MPLEKWQWAWLAGLFEGEGCISFNNKNGVQVKIVMTDHDVVVAVDGIVPSPRGIASFDFPHKKTQWKWQLSDRDEVIAFLDGVSPYLHSRRRARVEEALTRLANNRGDRTKRTHCPRGHALSGDNLYVNRKTGARSCWACRREHDRTRVRHR